MFYKIYYFLGNYNAHSFLRYTEQKERYGAFIYEGFELENI